MRQILFGTFQLPGYRHFVELAHMHSDPAHLGITAATLLAYDRTGRCVVRRGLDVSKPVFALDAMLPSQDGELLVGIDVSFSIERCELIYGYFDLEGSGTSGVYYPINFTKGLRDRASYLNTGNFSFGPLPEWVRPVLFIGNFAELGEVSIRVTTHYGALMRRDNLTLGPKRFHLHELERSYQGHPLSFMETVSTARLATYMTGMGPKGGFTFFEHLMPLTR